MPHVSQKEVSKKVFDKITSHFFESLFDQSSLKKKNFLSEILTDTEKIMLSKRLAIVFMLVEGFGYYKISKTLKVSISTIKRINSSLLNGEFYTVEEYFKNKKNKEIFQNKIENLFRMGLPEMGKNRWKILDKLI